MLSEQLKAVVEKAAVSITGKGGRGALVESGLIVTAAHCVNFSCEYPMAEDFWLEEIKTDTGTFRLSPYAVEPCHDVAILGEPDNQQPAFQDDVDGFETFCAETEPLRLCLTEFELSQPFPVYVYTHEGKWITGSASQWQNNAPRLFIEFDGLIKGGTSGSPIVNEAGEIVALVSLAGGSVEIGQKHEDGMPFLEKGCSGASPRPHMALPVWAINRITRPLALAVRV
jgi:hypothetical protein